MSQRLAYIMCFLTVVVILGTGVYLEYVEGIMPCPLCTLQRICFSIAGAFFLLGIFLFRRRIARIIINIATLLISSVGAFLAGRQIWIQAFPHAAGSECGVSLNYMLSVLPLKDVATKIFSGSTECTQRGWEFMNLNIPEWSLLFFIVFLLTGFFYLIREYKS
tara:strand:+ start:298 stop:786 length:489 start_codon:yes stop_codon:yes gene_type:complete